MMSETKPRNIIPAKLAKYEPASSIQKYDARSKYVTFGDDNNHPCYLIDLYETAPVHGALTTSIIEMIAGKGFEPNEFVTTLNLDKHLPAIAFDVKLQDGFYLEHIYDQGLKKIARTEHLPYENCRISLMVTDLGEVVNGVFYSDNWDGWTRGRKNIYRPRFIPIFKQDNPEKNLSVASVHFGKLSKGRYYPIPDYYRSLTWIVCEKEIGIYHVNNLMNGLFPAFMVNFRNGQIPPDEQDKVMDTFQSKMGTGMAGTTFFTWNEDDKSSPEVVQFPISDADKQYQFLLKAATEQVMIGHRVTSPLLFGIRTEGGLGSNADEMNQAEKRFNGQVIEPFQRFICDGLEEVFGTPFKIIPNTQIDAAPALPISQSEQKKKAPKELDTIELSEFGEGVDPDWILIDYYPADAQEIELVSTGTARPNAKSEQDDVIDDKIFITRYRYAGNLSNNSREFCVKMVGANKLYRKEDIQSMDLKVCNAGWGPHGADTYSIWKYKGGGYCGHWWEKTVFVSAKGLGIDVNSPKAKEMAADAARALGYKTKNNALVATPPFDMPNYGFLPTNPKS